MALCVEGSADAAITFLITILSMSRQALARKWRPQTFEQVMGQTVAVKALSNALNQQQLHHAYLLTGTRGVGKTSLARIIAKCLNCEKGVSAESLRRMLNMPRN